MRMLIRMQKTIYVKSKDVRLYMVAGGVAADRGVSFSDAIAEALVGWCRKHGREVSRQGSTPDDLDHGDSLRV